MAMRQDRQSPDLAASVVLDANGKRLGTVGCVYLDEDRGEPVYVTVDLGPFGASQALVPLANASISIGKVQLAFDGLRVRDAPDVEAIDDQLDDAAIAVLVAHYEP